MVQSLDVPAAKRSVSSPDRKSETELDEDEEFFLMSSGDSPRCRRGTIPLLDTEIIVDDHFGTKVLIFPKVQELGGTIDPDAMIDEPMEMCQRIFVRASNWSSHLTIDSSFDAFLHGPVSALLYHEIVRAKIKNVLHGLGLQVQSFDSIDNDETFIKIWLDRKSEVLKSLAQRYQYKMAYRAQAYANMPASGNYPGGKPMANSTGKTVYAYTSYEPEIAHELEDFREVDVIRLLELCLDEWFNFQEMLQQGVITHAFTAANYDQVKELHYDWGTLTKVWCLPNSENIDQVRNYFGEEVAFFFRWFAFYTRMLAPLALFGFICGVGGHQLVGTTLKQRRYLQVGFTFVLIGWASVFNCLFKHCEARERQRWGMKDQNEVLLERASWNPHIEGTVNVKCRLLFSRIFPMLYCTLFMCIVLGVEWYKQEQRRKGHSVVENKYISTALLIKVFSVMWARIAPRLTELQNHRTQGRFNNALIGILGSVKLFVTLFPFIHEAFLKEAVIKYCGDTLDEAAQIVYGGENRWPTGIPKDIIDAKNYSWLEGYWTPGAHEPVCIHGCFPSKCFPHHVGPGNETHGFVCVTNCIVGLEKSLESVYLLHIASTVAILLIPIALTRIAIEREILKDKAEGKFFSLLQLQAKCCAYAKYEYMSWGGSQVEDFLELAVGFALLTCFGIVSPHMAVLALFSHIVEFRLLAYRMTNITCRPFPLTAEGIGTWQTIFEAVAMCAVATNVGLAVTQMYPIRFWEPQHKLVAFVLMEHSLACIYIVVTYILPAEPVDVKRIEDFHIAFKQKKAWRKPLKVPSGELCNVDHVNISATNAVDDARELQGQAKVKTSWL